MREEGNYFANANPASQFENNNIYYEQSDDNSIQASENSSALKTSSKRKVRTPGKKLFKKLFKCRTPNKGISTALSYEDLKYTTSGRSNKKSNQATFSDLGTSTTSGSSDRHLHDVSFQSAASRTAYPTSGSRRSSKSSADIGNETAQTMLGFKSTSPMMKGAPVIGAGLADPTSVPLPDSPVNRTPTNSNSVVDNLLATTSPDAMMEDIYLPDANSSSYSDSSPTKDYRSPSLAMKPPGMPIPTPRHENNSLDDDPRAILFPHPLRSVSEAPQVEVMHVNLSQSVSESVDESNHEPSCNDSAFLPDEFHARGPEKGAANIEKTYTHEEVQRLIQQAEQSLRDHLEDKHQHVVEEFQEEAEKTLMEHISQWKKDSDLEYERMNSMLNEEKAKTQQKHRELLLHSTANGELTEKLKSESDLKEEYMKQVSSLEEKLNQGQELAAVATGGDADINSLKKEYEEHRKMADDERLKSDQRVQLLEQEIDSLKAELEQERRNNEHAAADVVGRHQEEIQSLRASKDDAQQQVNALQQQVDDLRQQVNSSNMEELIMIKSEKAATERQVKDLQEQVESKIAASKNAQAQLRESHDEIELLKQQLEMASAANQSSAGSDVSTEELFVAKAEIETLQALRAAEENERQTQLLSLKEERDDLLQRLKSIEEKYNIEMNSPRRKRKESQVEIRALTIEVEPSPRKLDGGTSILDTTMESENHDLQAEKENLEAQIRKMQETHSADIEKAVQEVRVSYEEKIQELQSELERQANEFESTKRSLKADLSVQEIEELTSEVEALKKRHEEEMAEHLASAVLDVEKARNAETERTKKLLAGFEVEKQRIQEMHAEEIAAVRNEASQQQRGISSNRKQDEEIRKLQIRLSSIDQLHQAEIVRIRQQASDELQQELQLLQARMDMDRVNKEKEKFELIEESEKECDALRVQIVKMKEDVDMQIQDATEKARDESRDHIKDLNAQLEKVRTDMDARTKTVTEQYIKEMQAKFDEQLDDTKLKAQKDKELVQNNLETVIQERDEVSKRVQSLEKQLSEIEASHQEGLKKARSDAHEEMEKELKSLEETIQSLESGDNPMSLKVKELQARLEEDRLAYNEKVRLVRAEHGKEIEELLGQLDLVEAEHNEKFAAQGKLIKEKDAVISALGAQLAEAQTKLGSTSDMRETMERDITMLREQLSQARIEIETKSKDLERFALEHEKAMEQEAMIREKVAEEAREEMIQRAEVQFEQANETYKKLKHEFDVAVNKISSLERDLRGAQDQVEAAKKELEAREADFADKLAQAKAEIATNDLQSTRKVKQYRAELESSKENESRLMAQLDEALATSRSVQSTLAAVVSEKEKLITEHNEMKSVCEELMAMVEGNQ